MRFREVLKKVFYEFVKIKDEYKLNVNNKGGMRKDLVLMYCEYILIGLHPICPHITEILYIECIKPYLNKYDLISKATFPNVKN